jgi:HSP20 family molecular chaperone IbpA
MRHVDFSPLYRSTVGFDKLLTMLDSLAPADQSQSYPPYNIERTGETTYRITMAVAGFDETEISIEARENVLTVKGEKAEDNSSEGTEFLYRVSPSAHSSAASSLPIMSRLPAHRCATVFCTWISCGKFPRQ